MGRPPKFDSEQILDATASVVAESGPRQATVAAISERLGAPSGSIYHRFASRELLLARLWIRTIYRAQQGFVAALLADDLRQAAHDAALHIPRWSRTHLDEATVLLVYRRADLAERWPREFGDELAVLNKAIERAMRQFTRRRYGRLTPGHFQRVTFALVDVPYAACRRHLLSGEPPPSSVDELVVRTCDCLLFDEGD